MATPLKRIKIADEHLHICGKEVVHFDRCYGILVEMSLCCLPLKAGVFETEETFLSQVMDENQSYKHMKIMDVETCCPYCRAWVVRRNMEELMRVLL